MALNRNNGGAQRIEYSISRGRDFAFAAAGVTAALIASEIMIDWATLSAPQAAVLAALIGILSAVIGQLIGSVIGTVSSSVQAKRSRAVDVEKFNLQLQAQRSEAEYQRKRAAYLDFIEHAQAVFELIIDVSTNAADATRELSRSTTDIALAGAPEPVRISADAVIGTLQTLSQAPRPDRASARASFEQDRQACVRSMITDLDGARQRTSSVKISPR